ncbi:MAG: alpha/beta hydrolase [Oxalobacteraceae bacterium]|nr:alpha/beta hydrolase [Oxalobacteraceae bacterium]
MSAKLKLDWCGREIAIEYRWVDANDTNDTNDAVTADDTTTEQPVIVFLHEGLGSVSLWKDFPDQLCTHLGMRGLVYSRPGYGKSTPRATDEHWATDFMHRQAYEVLPMLLAQLNVQNPWLLGHSDGASIALLYAAQFPAALRGAIVVAPHLFVEDISIQSIRQAREAYLRHGLRERLARHHDDVDSAFFGWNDIWLSERFKDWNIEAVIPSIRCPLLALQGAQDEYGSLAQIMRIRESLSAAEVITLANCGHSPHRDQAAELIAAVATFISRQQ